MNIKFFRRMLPDQKEEIIEVSDDPNEPIDITHVPFFGHSN